QNTAGNLTDYQVKIEINLSQEFSQGKIQQYCQDVRFTWLNSTSNQEQKISYWIEQCNLSASGNATFWIKVPFLENNTNTTVYLYYGNSGASSESDGEATFEFFDDFEDLEGWVNDAGYSVSNSELVQNANSGTENKKFYYSEYEPSSIRNLTIRLKWRSTSGGYVTAGWWNSNNNWNGVWWYDGDSNGDAHIKERWDSYSFNEYTYGTTDNNIPQNVDNSYIFEFRADESNFYLVVDDVQYASSDIDYDDTPMHIGYGSWNSGYPAYSDWILVRKFANPEPSISIGEEQPITSTDSQGNYSYTFKAPLEAGNHIVKVNLTDSDGIYGENSTSFISRIAIREQKATFELSGTPYIDADDLSTNPNLNISAKVYKNLDNPIDKVWVNITLPNGTTKTYYLTNLSSPSETGYWYKVLNITQEFNNLWGQYNVTFYANSTLQDNSTITQETPAPTTEFYVQNISISVTTDKSLYNPGENITVSGKVILLPDNTNVSNTNVSIWLDNVFQLNCTTDSYGNYSCNITAPSESGTHTITVNLTTEHGISGENSTTFMSNNLPVVEEPRTYSESLVEKTSFEQNEKVVIRVNVTDPDGAEQIDKVLINITSANGNLVVESAEMVNISSITNGYVFEYNYTLTNLQSDEFGTWQIEIWANDTYSQSDSNSSSFEVINTPPSLVGISYECEEDCGWGERWVYKVNLTEPNNNTVNVSFWYSYDGSTWVYKDSEVISCPPAGCYNITINFTFDPGWEASDADQIRYFKFNASDGASGTNETSQSVLVQKDDVSIEYIAGNETQVNRNGTESVVFKVRIFDTDLNQYVGSGVNTSLWVTTDGSSYYKENEDQLTDNLGFSNITFDPDSSIYHVGKQKWIIGTDGDESYKDANSSAFYVTIIGDIAITLDKPSGQSYKAGTDSVTFRWRLTDDNSTAVTGADNTIEIKLTNWQDIIANCSVEEEGNGWYNCTWFIPADQDYGWYDIRINASKQYFNNQSFTFDDKFEVATTPPTFEVVSYEYEQDGGWGERWIYRVNLTEINPDTVNVSLWYNRTGSWELVNSTNITCPCSDFVVEFVQDPGWEAGDVGTRYFKFNASDYVGGNNETDSVVVNVQRDDAIAIIVNGSEAIARRWGEEKTLFRIRINDTDRGVWVEEGVNCTFYFTKDGSTYSASLENQTDSLGYCSIYLKPNCSYSVGAQHWKGGTTDQAYKPWNTTEQNYSVKGKLT
ncbi:MAG: hypothetical protein DRN95_05485, partial [Candidatus Hydrothermarchaeota archaeon]